MPVRAFVLIHTEVGKSAQVAAEVGRVEGVATAEAVMGVYDVIARAEADTVDDLGRLIVSRLQLINGVTRTLTCQVVAL